MGKSKIPIRGRRNMRTSEAWSGRATNARVSGPDWIFLIRLKGGELDIGEQIRPPMLDGKVEGKEEEGDQGCGGEECPFSSSKGFGAGCEWERYAEVVPITKEGVFQGRYSHCVGGVLEGCRGGGGEEEEESQRCVVYRACLELGWHEGGRKDRFFSPGALSIFNIFGPRRSARIQVLTPPSLQSTLGERRNTSASVLESDRNVPTQQSRGERRPLSSTRLINL